MIFLLGLWQIFLSVQAQAQLVGPGALVPGGHGSGGNLVPRGGGGGWSVVTHWAEGFYIGGSSIEAINGVYKKTDAEASRAFPHLAFAAYENSESKWMLINCLADWKTVNGLRDEWIIVDELGRHVMAQAAGEYLPKSGPSWIMVDRKGLKHLSVGDRIATKESIDGFWRKGTTGIITKINGTYVTWIDDENRSWTASVPRQLMRLENSDDISIDIVKACTSALVQNSDDLNEKNFDLLPWQVVGIYSPAKVRTLIEQRQRWKENVAMARSWSFIPDAATPETFDLNATETRSAGALARRACRPHEAERLLANASSPDDLLELALARLDLGRYIEAIQTLLQAYALRRALPGLGRALLLAHCRARRQIGDQVTWTIFNVYDNVITTQDLPGFWRQGEEAIIVGLGSPCTPIALRLGNTPREYTIVDTTPDRILHAFPQNKTLPSSTSSSDHYALLGLCLDFEPEDLRRAFRNASRRTHSDKGGEDILFRRTVEAKDTLGSDQARREAYDSCADLDESRTQSFSLTDEIYQFYYPELVPLQPFGDPLENRFKYYQRKHQQRGSSSRGGSWPWRLSSSSSSTNNKKRRRE